MASRGLPRGAPGACTRKGLACLGTTDGNCCLRLAGAALEPADWAGGIIASLGLLTPVGAPGALAGLTCLGITDGICCLGPDGVPPMLDEWAGAIIASLGEGFLIIGCD